MRMYKCKVCHGLCDPGELEGDVCFDCRKEDIEKQMQRQAQRSFEIRKEWNQFLQQRYKQQIDGQMAIKL